MAKVQVLVVVYFLVKVLNSCPILLSQESINHNCNLTTICQHYEYFGKKLLQHPTDCQQYFYCSKGVALILRCSKNKYFNESEQKCVKAKKSRCIQKCTDHNLPICSKGIQCLKTKRYASHPSSCQMYYKCLDGFPIIYECPKKYFFSDKKQKCVKQKHVKCSEKCRSDLDQHTNVQQYLDLLHENHGIDEMKEINEDIEKYLKFNAIKELLSYIIKVAGKLRIDDKKYKRIQNSPEINQEKRINEIRTSSVFSESPDQIENTTIENESNILATDIADILNETFSINLNFTSRYEETTETNFIDGVEEIETTKSAILTTLDSFSTYTPSEFETTTTEYTKEYFTEPITETSFSMSNDQSTDTTIDSITEISTIQNENTIETVIETTITTNDDITISPIIVHVFEVVENSTENVNTIILESPNDKYNEDEQQEEFIVTSEKNIDKVSSKNFNISDSKIIHVLTTTWRNDDRKEERDVITSTEGIIDDENTINLEIDSKNMNQFETLKDEEEITIKSIEKETTVTSIEIESTDAIISTVEPINEEYTTDFMITKINENHLKYHFTDKSTLKDDEITESFFTTDTPNELKETSDRLNDIEINTNAYTEIDREFTETNLLIFFTHDTTSTSTTPLLSNS